MTHRLSMALCALIVAGTPASAAELAYPNGVEESLSLWSSEAEFHAIWRADPPGDPWLLADAVASTYDVGSRALRAGDPERAYRLWLSLAQAGGCRAKFAVGYLLDPASPRALESVSVGGHVASDGERAEAAFAWHLSAAEEGWAAAQRRVGDAYADGTAVPADPAAAKLWYRRAARNGDPDAMLAVANLFLRPDATPEERREGLFWARVVHDAPGLWWYDRVLADPMIATYEDLVPPRDIVGAMESAAHWRPLDDFISLAAGGHPDYRELREAERTVVQSFWHELPTPISSSAAAFDEGAAAYFGGDIERAVAIWWPLARGGHCQAQNALGALLDGPWSQAIDRLQDSLAAPHAPGALLRLLSAVQGNAYAQESVAVSMTSPHGTPVAIVERWARRAIGQGLWRSERWLNSMPEDPVALLVRQLCEDAAFTGRLPTLDRIRHRGTEPELSAALRQAAAWRPEIP